MGKIRPKKTETFENWTNGKLASAIMKKLKSGPHFINMHYMEKFQITDPPKFGSLVFQVSTETE